MGHGFCWEWCIELNDGERVIFLAVASERKVGDVCFGLSKGRADCADDSRAVIVLNDEEVSGDVGIDVKFIDLDNAWRFPNDGAGKSEALPLWRRKWGSTSANPPSMRRQNITNFSS